MGNLEINQLLIIAGKPKAENRNYSIKTENQNYSRKTFGFGFRTLTKVFQVYFFRFFETQNPAKKQF